MLLNETKLFSSKKSCPLEKDILNIIKDDKLLLNIAMLFSLKKKCPLEKDVRIITEDDKMLLKETMLFSSKPNCPLETETSSQNEKVETTAITSSPKKGVGQESLDESIIYKECVVQESWEESIILYGRVHYHWLSLAKPFVYIFLCTLYSSSYTLSFTTTTSHKHYKLTYPPSPIRMVN